MIKKENAITLIALVITIIVLLILAGITTVTLTGDNGILRRAAEAKNKTDEAALEEKIKLLASESIINEYTGENDSKTAQELQDELNNQGENVLVIQWDKYIIFDLNENKEYRVMSDGTTEYWGESTMGQILLNTKTANSDQISQSPSTNNIIGIDNERNIVNMLLWEYTLIEDESLGKVGTYGLNDVRALDGVVNPIRTAGYIGGYTEDGKIIGTVPAYISENSGNTYIAVTSMVHTFYDCDELIVAPEIADTVTNMMLTFYQSSNLTTAPSKIPDSVMDLNYAFSNCEKLNTVPILGKNIENIKNAFRYTGITEFNEKIPNSVTDMTNTFLGCIALANAPEIPNSVTNLTSTFKGCTALTTASEIPNSVTNMTETFMNCTALTTAPEIPNSVTNMQSTFMGCTLLAKGPSLIPESVTNMFQTFNSCSNLSGIIQINANLNGKIVYQYNERDYKDYEQSFLYTSTNGSGLIISKNSTCPELENLLNTKSSSSNITIEK